MQNKQLLFQHLPQFIRVQNCVQSVSDIKKSDAQTNERETATESNANRSPHHPAENK